MRKVLLFVGVLAFFATSCKDDKAVYTPFTPEDNSAAHSDSYQNAGLGENPGVPAGALYSLPAGIEIVGYVHGNAPTIMLIPAFDKEKTPGIIPIENPEKTNWISFGYGSLVNLYFTLYNNNTQTTTVNIPKGTICYEAAHTPSNQHGLLVKGIDIIVPPNDSTNVHLSLFCVNAHHGIATSTTHYKLGIITIHPDLVTVCNILDAKPAIDPADYGSIQSIIWKITDNGGFNQADIDSLNAM